MHYLTILVGKLCANLELKMLHVSTLETDAIRRKYHVIESCGSFAIEQDLAENRAHQ